MGQRKSELLTDLEAPCRCPVDAGFSNLHPRSSQDDAQNTNAAWTLYGHLDQISIVELIEIFKNIEKLEAPPGFEPGMEVLQIRRKRRRG